MSSVVSRLLECLSPNSEVTYFFYIQNNFNYHTLCKKVLKTATNTVPVCESIPNVVAGQ